MFRQFRQVLNSSKRTIYSKPIPPPAKYTDTQIQEKVFNLVLDFIPPQETKNVFFNNLNYTRLRFHPIQYLNCPWTIEVCTYNFLFETNSQLLLLEAYQDFELTIPQENIPNVSSFTNSNAICEWVMHELDRKDRFVSQFKRPVETVGFTPFKL